MNLKDKIISKYMEELASSALTKTISNVTRLSDDEVLCDVLIKDTGSFHKEVHIVFNNFDFIEDGLVSINVELSFPLDSCSGVQILSTDDMRAIEPTSNQIKQARLQVNLTQEEAAYLIHKDSRTWQRYEADETPMHPAYFELFKKKSIEHNEYINEIKEAFAEDHFKLYTLDIMSTKGPVYQSRVSDKVWVAAYQEEGCTPTMMKDSSADLHIHTLEIIDIDINTYSAYIRQTQAKGNDLQGYEGWQPLDLYKIYNTHRFLNVKLSEAIDRT